MSVHTRLVLLVPSIVWQRYFSDYHNFASRLFVKQMCPLDMIRLTSIIYVGSRFSSRVSGLPCPS